MKEISRKNTIHERTPIKGTPFTMAKTEKGYTLLMGLYALTPTLKTKAQITKYMKENDWNLIVNVIHAMLDFHKLINQKEINKREQHQIDDMKGPELPF